jgi:hypothetical protein
LEGSAWGICEAVEPEGNVGVAAWFPLVGAPAVDDAGFAWEKAGLKQKATNSKSTEGRSVRDRDRVPTVLSTLIWPFICVKPIG